MVHEFYVVKRVILIVLGIGALALGLWGLYSLIPFNITHDFSVQAYHLRNSVKDWEMRSKPEIYGHSNSYQAYYHYKTNIVLGSNVFSSVMRLDCSGFRNRGYLLATENQRVFWVGVNRDVQELKPQGSGLTTNTSPESHR